jgi:hypothetical protein
MIIRKLFIEVTIIPDMHSTPKKGVIDTSSIISIRKEESGYVIIETKDKDVWLQIHIMTYWTFLLRTIVFELSNKKKELHAPFFYFTL